MAETRRLLRSGDPAAARNTAVRALVLEPGSPEVVALFAAAALAVCEIVADRIRAEAARLWHDRSRLLGARHPADRARRALCRLYLGETRPALDEIAEARREAPGEGEVYRHLHRILRLVRPDRSAENTIRRALVLRPDDAEALIQLLPEIKARARYRDVHTVLRRALACAPDHARARMYHGILLLQNGRLRQGWPEFEFRRRRYAPYFWIPIDRSREWDGQSPLDGKRVLVLSEQGFGDDIQFIRYARALQERGATVITRPRPPLQRLFKQVQGIDRVMSTEEMSVDIDHFVWCMSLPGKLGTELDSIPDSDGYIAPDAALLDAWRNRVPDPMEKPRIAIAWRGNPDHGRDRERSLSLQQMLDMIPPGVEIVGLHPEIGDHERGAIANRPDFLDVSEDIRDFADVAAICGLSDLVISVDTAAAHLAGALGRPICTLLPRDPDWRWMNDTPTTPWYRSMRLFRQPEPGAWRPVLDEVRAMVAERFGLKPKPVWGQPVWTVTVSG